LTRDETKAKAAVDKLKECDEMHEELNRLRNIEQLVINMRNDQQAGKIPNDAKLPNLITSLLPPPPPHTSTPRRRANDVPAKDSVTRQILGGRRRKTRRRRKRRRKTKRIKKLN